MKKIRYFGCGLIAGMAAAQAGVPAPLSDCFALTYDGVRASATQGRVSQFSVVSAAGVVQWVAQTRAGRGDHSYQAAVLDSSRSKIAMVDGVDPTSMTIVGRDGRRANYKVPLNTVDWPIQDVSWENGGVLKVKFGGKEQNAFVFVRPLNWPVDSSLEVVSGPFLALDCVGGGSVMCIDTDKVFNASGVVFHYPYSSPAWQPEGMGSHMFSYLTPAGSDVLVDGDPGFQILVLQTSRGFGRLQFKVGAEVSEVQVDAKGVYFFDIGDNKYRVEAEPGAATMLINVVKLPSDMPLAEFEGIVELAPNGYGALTVGRRSGLTDLVTFAQIASPSVKGEGRAAIEPFPTDDFAGVRRMRRTARDTVEVSGDFGFAEFGFSVTYPWKVTLGPVAYRPSKIRVGGFERPVMDWRCAPQAE